MTAVPAGGGGGGGGSATPRKHPPDEQQPPAGGAASGAASSGASPAQQPPAANGAADPPTQQQPLPPVKTLLEFVAWAALEREAAPAADGGGGLDGEQLARDVRGGFLAQQLPELGLAVRRMQTGEPRAGAAQGLAGGGGCLLLPSQETCLAPPRTSPLIRHLPLPQRRLCCTSLTASHAR